MPTGTTKKRSYNSSRRTLQAAQTRDAVVHAAIERFGSSGWAGTTLAAIAEDAGVSVETIYNGFGSKKALLRAAMDVAVAGDTDPTPIAERPELGSLATGTLDERIARGVELVIEVHLRSAGVWQALVEASSGDAEVDGWRQELERARRLDTERGVSNILGREADDELVTTLWLLYSPAVYRTLTHDSGMSLEEYRTFLVDVSARTAAAFGIRKVKR